MSAEQHNDHIWLTVKGEAWAILAIRSPIIYLWRAWHPKLEFSAIDISNFNFESYCAAAQRKLS